EQTNTGGRLKRVSGYLEPDEPFCFTYGDGVSNVDLTAEIAFHKSHGKLATVCAVQPPGRYGALVREASCVRGFQEKPPGDGAWINGDFFVLEPKCLGYIDGDVSSWEDSALKRISKEGQLEAWEHSDFWQPMDTLREKKLLENLWESGNAPWKVWD